MCKALFALMTTSIAGLSVAGLSTSATKQQESAIIRAARRIASVREWALEPDYHWLDQDRILHYRHSKSPFNLKDLDRLQPYEADVFVFRLSTGRDEKARSLSRTLKKNECVRIGRTISPDGKWVSSVSFVGSRYSSRVRIRSLLCQLDGSSARRRPEMSVVWMPDSFRILGFHPYASHLKQRTRVDLYRLDRATPLRSFVIPYDNQAQPLDYDNSVVSKEGRLFAPISKWVVPKGKLMLFEWSPERPGDKGSIRTISLPDAYQVREAVLSPGADRIACILRTPPDANGRQIDGIWVSGVDGSGLWEIGRLKDGDYRSISFLKWLPSGSDLSFVYRTDLYSVSVHAGVSAPH
jgi:hypothetical protein